MACPQAGVKAVPMQFALTEQRKYGDNVLNKGAKGPGTKIVALVYESFTRSAGFFKISGLS